MMVVSRNFSWWVFTHERQKSPLTHPLIKGVWENLRVFLTTREKGEKK